MVGTVTELWPKCISVAWDGLEETKGYRKRHYPPSSLIKLESNARRNTREAR